MVAGYISDYKLTYDEDIIGEMDEKQKHLTVNDFKNNKGYVDDGGFIYIFREKPDKNEIIPWFTVVVSESGKPCLKFSQKRTPETRNGFRIEHVVDLSVKKIVDSTDPEEILYDEDLKNTLLAAGSQFVPEIKDIDDFLKKLVKTVILNKGCDLHNYRKSFGNNYQLSNYIQALDGTTKTGPLVFSNWMELLGCDFEITIHNNGTDTRYPLPYDIHYDSKKNEIHVMDGKEDENGKKKMPKSAKQFN